MITQMRVNLLDVQDYINLRQKHYSSNVKWQHTKHLIVTDDNCTLWNLCQRLNEDYNIEFEPSLSQLKNIEEFLFKVSK